MSGDQAADAAIAANVEKQPPTATMGDEDRSSEHDSNGTRQGAEGPPRDDTGTAEGTSPTDAPDTEQRLTDTNNDAPGSSELPHGQPREDASDLDASGAPPRETPTPVGVPIL